MKLDNVTACDFFVRGGLIWKCMYVASQFFNRATASNVLVFIAPCCCGVYSTWKHNDMVYQPHLLYSIHSSMKLFKLQYVCNVAFSVPRCCAVIDWCRPLITLPPTQSIAAFEEGSFLPLPSREAVERSIGKGGNGTITIVYFKGVEFAVKRISGWESYIYAYVHVWI